MKLSKRETSLINKMKQNGEIVVTDMADKNQRILSKLCEKNICRWEIKENQITNRNEIHYTLE